GLDIEGGRFTAQALGYQFHLDPIRGQVEHVGFMEHVQHLFCIVIQRAQQNGGCQLAPTVDAHVDVVLRIEFKVEPGAAIRDDPCRIQQLAGGVCLAPVMIEEHARDRKSTRLNSSHVSISYAVFCLKKKNKTKKLTRAS